MGATRRFEVQHLMMASTFSVYGANEDMPFVETQNANTQLTNYTVAKKPPENMVHSYAHLWDLPTAMFRFFTVYDPWRRPDLALFRFTRAILEDRPIDIYNHGEMCLHVTYVEDLVRGILLQTDTVPERPAVAEEIAQGDSLSPVAPYRVVNIGNSDKICLRDFIDALEASLGRKAQRNDMVLRRFGQRQRSSINVPDYYAPECDGAVRFDRPDTDWNLSGLEPVLSGKFRPTDLRANGCRKLLRRCTIC